MATTPVHAPALITSRQTNIPRGLSTTHPIVVTRGEGAYVWDTDARRYVDFVGGIGVMNVGHSHPRVLEAVHRQVDALTHTSFQVAMYESYVELATKLNALVGGREPRKSVLFSTGAEAIENAIKIARAFTSRSGVITFSGGFHGRTLLGMSLTGMSQPYKQNFGPFAPEIYHAPFPYAYRGVTTEDALGALQSLFSTDVQPERVAAILVEPVQGEGGFLPAPVEFLQALRQITLAHGIVLVVDEIQSGFGRTGRMFGFQHAGIEPDLVTIAKSLAAGFPLSAVTGTARMMDAPEPGGLGGTYGGNPVACAAALAVIETMERDHLVERAGAIGERVRRGFEDFRKRYRAIGDVRGVGAMLAFELVSDRDTRAPDSALAQRVLDLAREEGVLALKCGVHKNVIRCLVPLVATDETIDEGLAALDRALART